jgi:uncharacterized protein
MALDPKFTEAARSTYAVDTRSILLGAPLSGAECMGEPVVRLPLAMANRHGLIAGATGTGKTRTLQLMAEQLSSAGVPVFLADIKGDLSGLAAPGSTNDKISQRSKEIGIDWCPAGCPVEFLSLTGERGAQLRATVSSFGPLLLAKILSLNETQSGALALVFKYSDDRNLPLLDLADLRSVLQHLTGVGAEDLKDYGGIAKSTCNVILRKMVELEQQGAERFFGEPEFDLDDLLVVSKEGRGLVSVLDLRQMNDKPVLFSTFMMGLLARLYHELPEVGDLEKPKLVFFFDEAHLLFNDASKAFLDSVQQIVRLIRSKGVGIFFVTQNPRDVPEDILGQLGSRVQHALRAFTPADEKALRAAVQTLPRTPFYDLEATLTSLGIGDALVSVLGPSGVPTMPFATRLAPPASRMGPLEDADFAARLQASEQVREYAEAVDRESAREMLAARMTRAVPERDGPDADTMRPAPGQREPTGESEPPQRSQPARRSAKEPPSTLEEILRSPVTRTVTREVTRGVLGMLLGSPPRRRRRSLW